MTLLETVYSTLASNQLLVGGVGTLAFGSLMYLLRTVPQKILDIINRTLWTIVTVESLSNEYQDVDAFLEGRRLRFFSRSLEIKDGRLKTGFGGGWGIYEGILFNYSKTKSNQQVTHFETITVSFLSRDRTLVERFMRDSKPEEHKNSIYISMFNAGGCNGGLRRRKRALDTVFVDQAIKDRLVGRLTWFVGAEEWHSARGIPWKLGIILHGQPGTGKTSLIHALASDLGFDIKYIKSLHGLGEAFMSGTKNDLFVIEDIDTIANGLNRDSPRERDGSNPFEGLAMFGSPLHEILNSMDGMQTPDGLKFIVTTNHLDKLDPAIIRPGRIDEVIEIGPLFVDSARRMFKAFYGRDGIHGYSPRPGAELQLMFSTMTAQDAETELSRLASQADHAAEQLTDPHAGAPVRLRSVPGGA
ncbi:AAA family ATPase [Methylocapsa palsarum]|uniref:Chaperone BCS1 n=1 Tax=Methylocapsa palsarum TaxID=1612308 RepID=A0A1I4B2L7_9HYPH|nr:AAA family ATPase [Methylocapsa palsarum]SFK62129.1 chaperone BCS1 [Methylocapsa palsarum]